MQGRKTMYENCTCLYSEKKFREQKTVHLRYAGQCLEDCMKCVRKAYILQLCTEDECAFM
jgi:hypothetical protein